MLTGHPNAQWQQSLGPAFNKSLYVNVISPDFLLSSLRTVMIYGIILFIHLYVCPSLCFFTASYVCSMGPYQFFLFHMIQLPIFFRVALWTLEHNQPCFSEVTPKGCITKARRVNPLPAKFFRGSIKHIFTFYVIPPHWYDTGTSTPSSSKRRTYIFYIVNIMAADVLGINSHDIDTQLNRDNSSSPHPHPHHHHHHIQG